MRSCRIIVLGLLITLIAFAACAWAYNSLVTYQSRLVAWAAPASGHIGHPHWKPKDPRVIRILSLDGGGVHGLLTLQVLKYIEQKAQKPISELFDFVAGTSTGSIVAAQLLLPDAEGKPRYSVDDAADFYLKQAKRVFFAPWYHRILTLNGLLGPKFPNREKIAITNDIYGSAKFGDLLLPLMIPSYSITDSDLKVFRNWSPVFANMYVSPLVTAATSPPSVFPAIELEGPSDKAGEYMDGGVLANDPAQLAILNVLEDYPDAELVLISIGSGVPSFKVEHRVGSYGGFAAWIQPVIRIMLYGQGDVVSIWLRKFSKTDASRGLRYFRFNTHLPAGHGSFEDARAENLQLLVELGKSLVEQKKAELDQAIELVNRP